MKYETLHWCLVNILLRLFGIMASVAAFGFGLTALLQFGGARLPTPGVSALGNFFISAFCLALSVAFLTVSPYRPDLKPQDSEKPDSSQPKFGWWTGSPKKNRA